MRLWYLTFISTKASQVLKTNGNPESSATKTEIVDVVNGETCADLANFHLPHYGEVGADLHGTTPVVCGCYSSGYSKTCYKLTNHSMME